MLNRAKATIKRVLRSLLGLDVDAIQNKRAMDQQTDAVKGLSRDIVCARKETDEAKMLLGSLQVERIRKLTPLASLKDAEMKVFSQFGDDGIIQFLVNTLRVTPRTFIEFGVTDYREANTRFLLRNDNWRGLVMDSDPQMIERVKCDLIYVMHELTAVSAFIDANNINSLFLDNGCSGELGLLSIDIDGNDYWVWDAINVVAPVIVVCEYNSVFGSREPITVPYDPGFARQRAHPSRLYYGASLAALCHLADRKGYGFVGCNSNGNNAYFVRRDKMGPLRGLTPAEGYVESRFRESVDEKGQHTFVSGRERVKLIAGCRVVRVHDGSNVSVGSLNLF